MKKLFGRDKGKDLPTALPAAAQPAPMSTPIHQQFATRPTSNTADEERWEVVEQHTPPVTGPDPSPTRSPSPYTTAKPPSSQTLRKKTPPVLGILHSLDPVQQASAVGHVRNRSEERIAENGNREKGKGFWGREKERVDLEKKERRDDDNELTRKIGFLTATASEDWTLVLDVCDHASSSETAAKEAVRALRREFKYGEPAAQLAAARLWAIMLRNSSDVFISQCTSRKFLDTIEDLLTSSRISPVVRERVMDVLAAAAYASGSKKDSGFRGLWRRVKPKDKPEEGVPFDTEDAMFNPPLSSSRAGNYEVPPVVTYHDATPLVSEAPLPVSKRKRKTSEKKPSGEPRQHREHRHRIIPPDEDMRRLFQECRIGVGNATLLNEALTMATPEDLRTDVITEFHRKCMDSQELIFTQIPWASAGAERSRVARDQQEIDRKRKNSGNTLILDNDSQGDLTVPPSTREEELLGELLAANELLLEALKQYDDLKRVAEERQAEDRSRKDTKMGSRERQFLSEDGMLIADRGGGSSSRPGSPSPFDPITHQQTLAPPPAAPHGPRSPGINTSRAPSPAQELINGLGGLQVGNARSSMDDQQLYFDDGEEGDEKPLQPSAKALGKRRVVVDEPESGSEGGTYQLGGGSEIDEDRLSESDDEDTPSRMWQRAHHPVQHYVYDAVAERAQQRLMVNGVH